MLLDNLNKTINQFTSYYQSIVSICFKEENIFAVEIKKTIREIEIVKSKNYKNSTDIFNQTNSDFNLKDKRKGPLFEGKFKAIRVETNQQLLHLSRYIHLNPHSSQLKVTATLRNPHNRQQPLGEAVTTRSNPQYRGVSSSRIEQISAGTSLQFAISNQEKVPIYINILAIDSEGTIIVIFSPDLYSTFGVAP